MLFRQVTMEQHGDSAARGGCKKYLLKPDHLLFKRSSNFSPDSFAISGKSFIILIYY